MIDGQNFSNQPVKNDITYERIQKIAMGQGDNYKTELSTELSIIQRELQLIKIDMSEHHVLNTDLRARQ